MKFEDVKEGMMVRIMSDKHTEKNFGSGPSMREMIGKSYKINRIYLASGCVEIKGWNWDPKDICKLSTKPVKVKVENFDPQDLVL